MGLGQWNQMLYTGSGGFTRMTDRAKKVADTALRALEEVATEERRLGMARYFVTDMNSIGVTTPEVRKLAKRMLTELHEDSPEFVLSVANELIDIDALETCQLAQFVVSQHEPTMQKLNVRDIERLGRSMDNWAAVDGLACLITGELWRLGRLRDTTLLRWARSDNLWWRRTAVVSTTTLNKKSWGGTGDLQRTVMIVDLVKTERHPMIAKAVSWALRQLVSWEPDAVRAYLAENKPVLPALVVREVTKKLDFGVKNPRRKKV
jgi:3-methyladenine DNA glycosylase AlkD